MKLSKSKTKKRDKFMKLRGSNSSKKQGKDKNKMQFR